VTAFAIAINRAIRFGPELTRYLEEIDATLAPYEGRFQIHGGAPEVVEGVWDASLVVIAFPTMEKARAWYASPGYQAIVAFRTRNADSTAFLIEGVPEGYSALERLRSMRAT
jgi:uncharacterized protein (DUF1330 family)